MVHFRATCAVAARRRRTLAILILIVGLKSLAAQPVMPATTPRTYAPGEVNVEMSRIYIRVDKSGLGHVHGVAGVLKGGRVVWDGQRDAGELIFDLTSFVADVPYARKYLGIEGEVSENTQREVTENMLGPDVLDAKRYPTATFRIDSVAPAARHARAGGKVYVVSGRFTLHEATRPISFEVETEAAGEWIRARGSFKFKQSAFGIKPISKALGMVAVADELTVVGDIFIAAARP